MSEPAIDTKSVPDTILLRSQDFLCSPALQCAPLGGLNEFSVDYSAIVNLPNGPDGERMSPLWGEPAKIPVYQQQGYQIIPTRCFRGDWNGGKQKKMMGASPTVEFNGDAVYKEGRMLIALWTTATNKRRLDRNNDAAAERSRSGGGKYADATRNEDAATLAGMPKSSTWTEESFTTVDRERTLTMAGPASGKK